MKVPKYVERVVRANRRSCVYALSRAAEGRFFKNEGIDPFPADELTYVNHR